MAFSESDQDRRMRLLQETRDAAERSASATERILDEQHRVEEEARQRRDWEEVRRENQEETRRLDAQLAELRRVNEAAKPVAEAAARRSLRALLAKHSLHDPFASLSPNGSATEQDTLAGWQAFADSARRVLMDAETAVDEAEAMEPRMRSARDLPKHLRAARKSVAELLPDDELAVAALRALEAEVEPVLARAKTFLHDALEQKAAERKPELEARRAERAAAAAQTEARKKRRSSGITNGLVVGASGVVLGIVGGGWLWSVAFVGFCWFWVALNMPADGSE